MISFFSFVSSSNQIGHYTNFSLTNIFRSHSIFLFCLSSSWSAMQSLVFSLYIWKPLQRGGPEASLSPFTSKHCQQIHLKSKTLPVTSISGMQKTFYQVLWAKALLLCQTLPLATLLCFSPWNLYSAYALFSASLCPTSYLPSGVTHREGRVNQLAHRSDPPNERGFDHFLTGQKPPPPPQRSPHVYVCVHAFTS